MSDLDDLWDFDEIEDEIAPFTFNRGFPSRKRAPAKPNIAKVLEEKQAKREEERCKDCGSLKVRREEKSKKFRMVCAKCKNAKRVARQREQRGKTK